MFGNAAQPAQTEIINRIMEFGRNRPRALQTAVGCSSLGGSCDRKLAYQILAVAPSRDKSQSWAATIGTAVHSYLESIFATSDDYLTETPVTVGHGALSIPGTVDLYLKQLQMVVDFKLVGESTLAQAKAGKVSRQYQVQVQLYGLGLEQAGYRVSQVGILFLPRNKELRDSMMVAMQYDPQVATMALDRYRLIDTMVQARGIEALADLETEDAPCVWCDWFDPTATELAKGCPGKPLTPTIKTPIV